MIRIPKVCCLGVIALALLSFMAMPVPASEVRGTLTSVNAAYNQFALLDDDLTEHSFRLAEDGKVFINEEECQLSDLQPGDEVAVVVELRYEERVATWVRCTRGP